MKKIFRRTLSILLCVVIVLSLAACGKGGGDGEKLASNVVSRVVYDAEHPYIEHNGAPYLFYGVQVRLDWIMQDTGGDLAYVEDVIAHAKADGFNTIVAPIWWNYIEPKDGEYNFDWLEIFYKYLNKYDLLVQWLWFGTNSCGAGTPAPKWIKADTKTYWQLEDVEGDWFNFSCEALLEREAKALGKMMDWIAENDTDRRCVVIQVNNEVDQGANMFQPDQTDAVIAEENIGQWWQTEEGHDTYCWVGGQREAFFHYQDVLGQAVHNSKYNCVTRVNVSGAGRNTIEGIADDYDDLLATDGIDIMGVDCYSTTWDTLEGFITWADDNVTHIAEANSTYQFGYSAAKMFSLGAGILPYCFKGDRNGGGMYEQTGHYKDWVELESTPWMRSFNQMINKALSQLSAAVPSGTVLEFNGEHQSGQIKATRTLNGTRIIFTHETDALGMAFPVSDTEWVLMATDDNAVFEFGNTVKVENATFGKFEGLDWKAQNVAKFEGNKVTLSAWQVVKVDVSNKK